MYTLHLIVCVCRNGHEKYFNVDDIQKMMRESGSQSNWKGILTVKGKSLGYDVPSNKPLIAKQDDMFDYYVFQSPFDTMSLNFYFSIQNDLPSHNVTSFNADKELTKEIQLNDCGDTYMVLTLVESYTTQSDGHRVYEFGFKIDVSYSSSEFWHVYENRVPLSWSRYREVEKEAKRNFPYRK